MARPIVVIPARLGSTRLPRKPLADIHGAPMIVHVVRRAVEADVGPVLVAADDAAIVAAVEAEGARGVLTRPDHASGSDRIAEALALVDPDRLHDIVVNVQGDLPTIERAAVRAALAPLEDASVDIATLATPIRRAEERDNPNVVKAVGTPVGPGRLRALYFTRATAPWGFTRIAAARWNASSHCRPPRWSAASGWSSCGRSKPGCGSTSRSSMSRRSASIRPRIWSAPACC
jgi:3-deoxy-manno-octulosonate cytidylyltransferase (CMP-KDO synthetase)